MRRILLGLVALALIGSACGGGKPAARGSTTPSPSPAGTESGDLILLHVDPYKARYGGTADVRGKAALQMSVARFAEGKPVFAPTIVIGSPGQKLTITIVNMTPAAHTFTIDASHVDQQIGIGETPHTVEVSFRATGSIVFYCKIHYVAEPIYHAGELLVQA